MKKSIIYLLIFCLAFCMIFTACATRMPQNTDDSQSTSGSQSTTDSQSTTESKTSATEETTSQQTTEQSSATETTTQTTKQTKAYEVCHTKIRETKELQTEVSELQEKVDRYYEMDFEPKVQQKVIITIGDHRDVPHLYRTGHNQFVRYDYLVNQDPGSAPSFSKLQDWEEYMPVYTYTGTEAFVMELNDEIYNFENLGQRAYFRARSCDNSINKSFFSLKDMHQALPKGKYYISIPVTIYGNDIIGDRGYVDREFKAVRVYFVMELK